MRRFIYLLFCFHLLFVSCTNLHENSQDAGKNEKKQERQRSGKVITGKVIGISDGDTFKLLADGNQTIRVRLYGVDAPEKAQDYGTQARQKLSELIFSKEIEVEQKNKDRYGRVVGIAYADDINVNEELLRAGMVWQYTDYDKSERWAELEREARINKRGLWSQAKPTPPWQWRKVKRGAKQKAVEAE